MLTNWEGLKPDQIASIYRIPPATVRTRLHRARRGLAQVLQNQESPGELTASTADEPAEARNTTPEPFESTYDFTAEDLAAVEALPRLLLADDPVVSYLDVRAEGTASSGEFVLGSSDSDSSHEFNWISTDLRGSDDPLEVSEGIDDELSETPVGTIKTETVMVAGKEANLFVQGDYGGISWTEGDLTVRLDIQPGDPEAFISRLIEVDAATWLAALPENFVLPSQQEAFRAEALEDITAPEGFEPAPSEVQLGGRYQLGDR